MGNSFFENNAFYHKKVMIIIPHEDDEINLCGAMILSLKKSLCDIHVVYTTNGDYSTETLIRVKEATRSCKKLGILEENIHFLGYPDQYIDENSHIYMTKYPKIWTSNNQKMETYLLDNRKEYRFIKSNTHSQLNQEALIHDIKDIILDYLPNYLFVIDFDSHPDHRATSLSFEKAMGLILKENEEYKPIIYKGFAYPTSYLGVKDGNSNNILSTKFLTEKFSYFPMQNPYYSFGERVRFPVGEKCFTSNFFKNIIFKSLCCHKSQVIVRKANSIINNDQIYWQRRTDSYNYLADIKVSSGNPKYLNDFLLFDCLDIMQGKSKVPQINNCAWIPNKDDNRKQIVFTFSNKKEIGEIYFYQQCKSSSFIEQVSITLDDGSVFNVNFQKTSNHTNRYILPTNKISQQVTITIISYEGSNPGFSEIEIYKPTTPDINYIKIMSQNDFIYNDYENKVLPLNIYGYDGLHSKLIDWNEVSVETQNVKFLDGEISLLNKKKKGKLRVSLKENCNIYDEINLSYLNFYKRIKLNFIRIVSQMLLIYITIWQKTVRKIKKYIGR